MSEPTRISARLNAKLQPMQLASDGQVFSYWEGSSETAFYIYGTSFSLMQDKLREFLASYPLCQRCRVVQIA